MGRKAEGREISGISASRTAGCVGRFVRGATLFLVHLLNTVDRCACDYATNSNDEKRRSVHQMRWTARASVRMHTSVRESEDSQK